MPSGKRSTPWLSRSSSDSFPTCRAWSISAADCSLPLLHYCSTPLLLSVRPRTHLAQNPARQSLNPQEPFRVGLVVAAAAFHAGDRGVVEAVRAGAAADEDVAL